MSRPYIVLHGGFHKTATSHLQSLMARNSKMLERAGVHYVHHRDTRKRLTVPVQCNVYNAIGMDWDPKISDEELAEMTGAFLDELVATGADRIILSDENMAGHCGHCVKRGSAASREAASHSCHSLAFPPTPPPAPSAPPRAFPRYHQRPGRSCSMGTVTRRRAPVFSIPRLG